MANAPAAPVPTTMDAEISRFMTLGLGFGHSSWRGYVEPVGKESLAVVTKSLQGVNVQELKQYNDAVIAKKEEGFFGNKTSVAVMESLKNLPAGPTRDTLVNTYRKLSQSKGIAANRDHSFVLQEINEGTQTLAPNRAGTLQEAHGTITPLREEPVAHAKQSTQANRKPTGNHLHRRHRHAHDPNRAGLKSDPDAVYFDTGSGQLSVEGKKKIATLAAELRSQGIDMAEVDGFADKSGSSRRNRSLSQLRAESVKAELAMNGIEATIESKGSDHATAQHNRQDRRAQIIGKPKVASPTPGMNLVPTPPSFTA